MNKFLLSILSIFISGLSGCAVGPWGGVAVSNPITAISELQATKARQAKEQNEQIEKDAEPKVYGPPQVVYRIDSNRYISLENYTSCSNGTLFYINKSKSIKSKIWYSGGFYNYRGELIWLAKSDNIIALPLVGDNSRTYCGTSGCNSTITYSTDGGVSYREINFAPGRSNDSKNYKITITDQHLYIQDNFDLSQNTATKYALNSSGSLYNVRDKEMNEKLANKLIGLGIPSEAIPGGNRLNTSILKEKLNFPDEQIEKWSNQAYSAWNTIVRETPASRIPGFKLRESDLKMSCNKSNLSKD